MTSLHPVYTGPMSSAPDGRAVPSNRRTVHSHRKSFEVPKQMALAIKQSIGFLASSAFNRAPRRPAVHPSSQYANSNGGNVVQLGPSPAHQAVDIRSAAEAVDGPMRLASVDDLEAGIPPSPPPAEVPDGSTSSEMLADGQDASFLEARLSAVKTKQSTPSSELTSPKGIFFTINRTRKSVKRGGSNSSPFEVCPDASIWVQLHASLTGPPMRMPSRLLPRVMCSEVPSRRMKR